MKGYPKGYCRPAIDRFNEKWELDESSGCWLWTASVHAVNGYSVFMAYKPKIVRGHRWSYEHFIGPIPDGLEIDHVCRVRRCVNPSHLRAVTKIQNAENRGPRSGSASGVRGVTRQKGTNRWQAAVYYRGVNHRLGAYATIEEAGEVARLKRLELQTHNDIDRRTDDA